MKGHMPEPLTQHNFIPHAIKHAVDGKPRIYDQKVNDHYIKKAREFPGPAMREPTQSVQLDPESEQARMDKKLGAAKAIWEAERKVLAIAEEKLTASNYLLNLGIEPKGDYVALYKTLIAPPWYLKLYAKTIIFFRKFKKARQ